MAPKFEPRATFLGAFGVNFLTVPQLDTGFTYKVGSITFCLFVCFGWSGGGHMANSISQLSVFPTFMLTCNY
jgi:hypothetical protein